jgi:hypothetical protein
MSAAARSGGTVTAADPDRLRRDHAAALENLTTVQARCNTLMEEARAARRELAALGPLAEVLGGLGADERAVILAIARWLAVGRKCYGALDVQGDARDWRAEAAEEALDCAVYLACETMRLSESGANP